MWKRLLALAAKFWRIAEDVEHNKKEIAELRQEVHRMGRVLDWLVLEFRHAREHDASEREKRSRTMFAQEMLQSGARNAIERPNSAVALQMLAPVAFGPALDGLE